MGTVVFIDPWFLILVYNSGRIYFRGHRIIYSSVLSKYQASLYTLGSKYRTAVTALQTVRDTTHTSFSVNDGCWASLGLWPAQIALPRGLSTMPGRQQDYKELETTTEVFVQSSGVGKSRSACHYTERSKPEGGLLQNKNQKQL